jgi:hypothetical protein
VGTLGLVRVASSLKLTCWTFLATVSKVRKLLPLVRHNEVGFNWNLCNLHWFHESIWPTGHGNWEAMLCKRRGSNKGGCMYDAMHACLPSCSFAACCRSQGRDRLHSGLFWHHKGYQCLLYTMLQWMYQAWQEHLIRISIQTTLIPPNRTRRFYQICWSSGVC